ncbi:MAG: hypothetical protein M0Q01_15930 [Syntrophales bacterium]|nr:hypothetical protein [Syntrophales bacterium]
MAIFLPGVKPRKDGTELPYIPLGIFKLRIPFVHWGWEMTEMFQAMVMFVTGIGAIALLQDTFGMSFEVALTIVAFHELTYCLHQVMGDPIIPGWITPAIPLTLAYLSGFAIGPDRVQALIALQLLVGLLFLILGLTGMAKKLLDVVPVSLQAGIILGAGIAATIGKYCFSPTGVGFNKYPISITIGGLLALYLLFSKVFSDKVRHGQTLDKSNIWVKVANYGMVPGLVVGIIAGWIVGEIPLPVFKEGFIFIPEITKVIQTQSIFGVGIPPMATFIAAIPMAIVAYIIAFGDMVIGTTCIENANEEFRPDEIVDRSPNRLSLLCALRNFIEGTFATTPTLAGPLWAAMTVAVTERYKLGRQAMDSIFGGAGSFNIMKFLSCLILPLVFIFKPALPVALSLTLLIQAFACGYIAMELVKNNTQRGLAAVIGAILAVGGPAMGLAIGIVLCLVLEGPKAFADRSKQGPLFHAHSNEE